MSIWSAGSSINPVECFGFPSHGAADFHGNRPGPWARRGPELRPPHANSAGGVHSWLWRGVGSHLRRLIAISGGFGASGEESKGEMPQCDPVVRRTSRRKSDFTSNDVTSVRYQYR